MRRHIAGNIQHHVSHIEEIEAPVDEVLNALKANRDRHESLYKTLQEAYVAKSITALEDRIFAFRSAGEDSEMPNMKFDLDPPDYYGPAYETAIGMLELHKASGNNTVKMCPDLYRAYVQDQWTWKEQFTFKNTRMYGVSGV